MILVTACLGAFFAGWAGGYTLRQLRRLLESV